MPDQGAEEKPSSGGEKERLRAPTKPIRSAARRFVVDVGKRGYIEICAAVVFVVASLVVSAILFLAILKLVPDGAESASRSSANLSAALYVRIAQIGLTIMAVSVTTALISRFYSVWGMTFGLIVIGALIVPTNDIVRFILLITGSERAYSEFYRAENPTRLRLNFSRNDVSVKDDADGRPAGFRQECVVSLIDDVIIYEIERGLIANGLIDEDLGAKERGLLHQTITRGVLGYSARESISNVLARGAVETLRAVALGDGVAFETAFQNTEKVREHLLYLRSEGLVTFPFERVETAEVTDFGIRAYLEIANATEEQDIRESLREEGGNRCVPDTGVRDRFGGARAQLMSPPRLAGVRAIALGRTEVSVSPDSAIWRTFEVVSVGRYSVAVRSMDDDLLSDPYFVLYNADRTLIDSDDDSHPEGTFDARIVRELEPGQYMIGMINLDPAAARFAVEINLSQSNFPDEQVAPEAPAPPESSE